MAKVPKEHWTKSRLLRVPQLPARVSSHQERIDALFQKPVDDEFASVLSAILTQITKRPITVKVIKPPESHYEIAVSSPKTATERPIKFSYRISQVFEEFNSAKDLPCSECGLPRDFARQPNGFPDMNLACCKNGHEVRNLVLNREIGQAHVAAQVITCQFAASTNPKARVNQRASVSKAILDEDGNTRLVASVNGEFFFGSSEDGKNFSEMIKGLPAADLKGKTDPFFEENAKTLLDYYKRKDNGEFLEIEPALTEYGVERKIDSSGHELELLIGRIKVLPPFSGSAGVVKTTYAISNHPRYIQTRKPGYGLRFSWSQHKPAGGLAITWHPVITSSQAVYWSLSITHVASGHAVVTANQATEKDALHLRTKVLPLILPICDWTQDESTVTATPDIGKKINAIKKQFPFLRQE